MRISLFAAFSCGRYDAPGVPWMEGGADGVGLDPDPPWRGRVGGTIYYHITKRHRMPLRPACARARHVPFGLARTWMEHKCQGRPVAPMAEPLGSKITTVSDTPGNARPCNSPETGPIHPTSNQFHQFHPNTRVLPLAKGGLAMPSHHHTASHSQRQHSTAPPDQAQPARYASPPQTEFDFSLNPPNPNAFSGSNYSLLEQSFGA